MEFLVVVLLKDFCAAQILKIVELGEGRLYSSHLKQVVADMRCTCMKL